jgi:hypothetical protein
MPIREVSISFDMGVNQSEEEPLCVGQPDRFLENSLPAANVDFAPLFLQHGNSIRERTGHFYAIAHQRSVSGQNDDLPIVFQDAFPRLEADST